MKSTLNFSDSRKAHLSLDAFLDGQEATKWHMTIAGKVKGEAWYRRTPICKEGNKSSGF